MQGKFEMTLELLTQQEAEEKPAGKGRDEPNQNPTLDPPKWVQYAAVWFSVFYLYVAIDTVLVVYRKRK